jgi:hypothetical protein
MIFSLKAEEWFKIERGWVAAVTLEEAMMHVDFDREARAGTVFIDGHEYKVKGTEGFKVLRPEKRYGVLIEGEPVRS